LAYLLRTFFGADVQDWPIPVMRNLQKQGALPDTWLATKQGDRAIDEPTAEYVIELGNSRRAN
jgi:hypothetical protein